MIQLHLIASQPSHGDRHVDPDATARMLSEHEDRDSARAAGRDYLADHPTAWLQTDGEGGIEDVEAPLVAPEFCIIAGCSNERHWPAGERAGYPYCQAHLPATARAAL